MDRLTTGEALKRWRLAHHLTQKQLSTNIGYSTSRIAHIESSNAILSSKLKNRLKKLEAQLHTPTAAKSTFQSTLANLDKYRSIYKRDIIDIENSILLLLTLDNEIALESVGPYFDYLKEALQKIIEIKKSKFCV